MDGNVEQNVNVGKILVERVKATAGDMDQVLEEYLALCPEDYRSQLEEKLQEESYRNDFRLGIGMIIQIISGAMVIHSESGFADLVHAVVAECAGFDEDLHVMAASYLHNCQSQLDQMLTNASDIEVSAARLQFFQAELDAVRAAGGTKTV